MLSATIVVERLHDCPWPLDGHRVITMDDYARNPRAVPAGSTVVNLCRNGYLARGYYCSLLAEARGDAVLPAVATLVGLNCRTLQRTALDRLSRTLALAGEEHPEGIDLHSSLLVVFGQAADPRLKRVAALAFELYPSPLLTIDFDSRTRRVKGVRIATARDVQFGTGILFRDAMERWLSGLGSVPPQRRPPVRRRPRLAILHDPDDPLPPSRPQTLERFRQVGNALGLDVDLIRHGDADRLAEFDALFIRETTSVRHPSFRLASRAEELGMPVVDDPHAILHCGNKVYLAERLQRYGVPVPRTVVTDGRDLPAVAGTLGYPLVLKLPDGCSSQGVVRADSPADLDRVARPLLRASHLIVAQEYVYTPFDWRVTVLAGSVLFACRYRMAAGHWQIFRHGTGAAPEEGATEAVPLASVPRSVLDAAVQAAALIGDGLYGVDVKDTDAGALVIEVNDNPNIDVGLEDAVLGEALYRTVLQEFLARIDARRGGMVPRRGAVPWALGAETVSVRTADLQPRGGTVLRPWRSHRMGMRLRRT